MHNGLVKLLSDATFPLKVREVDSFAKVITWFKELPERMKEAEKSAPPSPGVKKPKTKRAGAK